MSIVLMFIFAAIPVILGTIVVGATFHHWYKEARAKK